MLTSNGTRELSDALRRRCLYHYVDFPDVDREARIIRAARCPASTRRWRCRSRAWWRQIRKEDLRKVPGVAETLDWAATLPGLEVHDLRQEPEAVYETHDVPAQDPRGPRPADPRGGGAAARQGGVR